MRIAFIAADVDLGGVTGDVSHVKDVTTALARRDCAVTLFVSNIGGWTPPPGVIVHSIQSHGTLFCAFAIAKALLGDEPDAIYERRVTPKLAALVSVMLRCSYFAEVNGSIEEEKAILGRSGRRRLESLRLVIRACLLQRAAKVVTVTEGIRDQLIASYGISEQLLSVVPNGVDLDLFRPISRSEARSRLGLEPSLRYLIFVGNLVAWQGLDIVLSALQLIARERNDVRLIIVGDGPDRRELVRAAELRNLSSFVQFVGKVQREEVPDWIAAADIGIASKTARIKSFASPLKLREYLACGIPVVYTDLGGLEPSPARFGAGRVVPPDDAEAMSRAVIDLLSNGKLLEQMGVLARGFAEAELSWDRVATQLMRLVAATCGVENEGPGAANRQNSPL